MTSNEDSLVDPRLNAILDVVFDLASGNLDARGSASNRNDEIDAIIIGLNMLAEELAARQFELVATTEQLRTELAERRRIEEELRQTRDFAVAASRAKTEFLANMSHEIRTPMNAIMGMADLLSDSPMTPEQQEYVRIFRRAGNTLLNVINDVLDLSKVEAGQIGLEATDFDISDCVDQAIEILAIRAHEKGLELLAEIEPEVPMYVVGDAHRLRQVLLNLVGNAIKFTDAGEIILRVGIDPMSSEPGGLLFSVRDTGVGIPADRVSTIFESFSQADASTTRRYGGTGLGLTISRRLVELMGGRVWVESQLGAGSTFYFTAQFGVSPGAVNLPQVGQISEEILRGIKVLIVDDNATNRMVLRQMLVSRGAIVTEAACGKLGLIELARAREANEQFGLLLLDSRMPGLNGFEVAERIKHEFGTLSTAVIMLTSDRRSSDMVRVRELGLAGYLVKPVKMGEFLATIAAVLDHQSSQVPTRAESMSLEAYLAPDYPDRDMSVVTRVLLIDDSEDNRLLIRLYLKDKGYEVDIAENGEAGVEKFTTNEYDVVLMDVQMPVMDGLTATRIMRQWEKEHGRKATPIIALTASVLARDVLEALRAGCTDHLGKPVSRSVLTKMIAKCVRGT